MTKKTWKTRGMKAGIAQAMKTAPSITAAAKVLGVNRSTLHRLIKAGQAPPLTKPVLRPVDPARIAELGAQSPASLAETIRADYVLSAMEEALLGCACDALGMAQDVTLKPSDRLAASGRFARLIQQLDLETPIHGEVETPHTSGDRPWPRRVG